MIDPRSAESEPTVAIAPFGPKTDELVALLEGAGCRVLRLPGADEVPPSGWDDALVDAFVRPADALVGMFAHLPVTRNVLEAGERLRVVTSPIIGTEHIDVAACTEMGIVVGYGAVPENSIGVAEAVVMLVAALRKRLLPKVEAVRTGGWRVDDPGAMVLGSVVGLVGLGAIGAATAERLRGWGCDRVLGTDPAVSEERAADLGVELVELQPLLREADVVSVSVTLTDQTAGLIDDEALALMKSGSYLVNTSRGGVVDEVALLRALDDGHLAGAAIDTWMDERPDGDSRLRRHPRVIPTGHNVGHSEALYSSLMPCAAENTLRALRGEEPAYVRNPAAIPAWRRRLARLTSARADA